MFGKKEKQIPVDAPVADRARPYLEHKKRLSELDFQKKADMEILNFCLRAVSAMVNELNLDVEHEFALLKKWVENDYSNYISCAKNGVTHVDLLTLYLWKKIEATVEGNDGMSLITSYDNKLVINYRYETKKGETISYFDKALGVPTSLVATAELKLKLANAQKLVEKIDVDVKYIDAVIVNNFITATLNRVVRDTILNFIDKNNASFYDLPHYYTAINQTVLEALRAAFAVSGLDATDFALSDISVPNNTGKLLQNQFFAIAEAERVKAYEQRMEKASLDLYERKAAIHSKYPDFPITLTETEKDLALNRYLIRMGQDTSLKADIEEKDISRRVKKTGGTATVEHKTAKPTFIEKSNKFRTGFIIMTALLYLVAFALFSIGAVAGCAALAGATLVCGLTAFFGYKKIKYGTETAKTIGGEDGDEAVAESAPVAEVASDDSAEQSGDNE